MSGEVVEAELLAKVSRLPGEPGVYLFHDAKEAVLYVGKAQNLRQRVRQYFSRVGDGRLSLQYFVPRIADVGVIVTATAKEALLLENQLIKKHKPRFNVKFRDDKNYLGLRLDPTERYARFVETRRFLPDGAVYFGPYTSSRSLRKTLSSLQKIFPLRTCSDGVFKSYARQGRPCIEYSVGRCVAPCCGKVGDEAYADLVQGAVRLMKGQSSDLLRELKARMEEAADKERFEVAGRLRDRIQSIEGTVERQAMVSPGFTDRDVFGVAREGRSWEVEVLHIRQGKINGGHAFGFNDVHIDDGLALESFLDQFYAGDRDLPRELLVPVALEDSIGLEELWRERVARGVKIIVPRRGEGRRLMDMATRNAELALRERTRRVRSAEQTLKDVGELLRLEAPPRRIECYDTSHLSGTLHVASRVVFFGGEPEKKAYRRYKLSEAAPGDDYAALREALRRRFARAEADPAPDLILLDGGKGQLGALIALLKDLGIEQQACAALAKERDADAPIARVQRHGGTKSERIFLPGVKDPLLPAADSGALLFLQRVRDESHRFAIRYHRLLRSKMNTRSILDELPGIGPAKRRALLRQFGSLKALGNASEDELCEVPHISRADARRIVGLFLSASNESDALLKTTQD